MIKQKELTERLGLYHCEYPDENKYIEMFMHTQQVHQDSFFSRENYNPGHVTASSFVFTPDNQFILLIFHKTLKRWLQPGGHIEVTDNSLEGAAKRELLEETNIAPQMQAMGLIDLDVHTIPAKAEQPSHQHFDMRFLFISEKKHIYAGSDATEAKWISVAKLTPDNADKNILRTLRKVSNILK